MRFGDCDCGGGTCVPGLGCTGPIGSLKVRCRGMSWESAKVILTCATLQKFRLARNYPRDVEKPLACLATCVVRSLQPR